MPTHVVRFPKATALPAVFFLLIAAVGLFMWTEGRGHWTVWYSGAFAVLGTWLLIHVLFYRTVFYGDSVEQRVFPWLVHSFRYVDIERIILHPSGRGKVLLLSSRDGRQMRVHGETAQLTEVRNELLDRFPAAFGSGATN